jgi:hypothetical protein
MMDMPLNPLLVEQLRMPPRFLKVLVITSPTKFGDSGAGMVTHADEHLDGLDFRRGHLVLVLEAVLARAALPDAEPRVRVDGRA